ncbi:conserved hypothetical protein [Ricinus communis]|uniref:Uncharacterized protein n=1 Tax=Ricinus communis TaxID=3988 RepID=B9TGQ3_RICCO|nr:conserved hypothetical protein [Ricinus communis]
MRDQALRARPRRHVCPRTAERAAPRQRACPIGSSRPMHQTRNDSMISQLVVDALMVAAWRRAGHYAKCYVRLATASSKPRGYGDPGGDTLWPPHTALRKMVVPAHWLASVSRQAVKRSLGPVYCDGHVAAGRRQVAQHVAPSVAAAGAILARSWLLLECTSATFLGLRVHAATGRASIAGSSITPISSVFVLHTVREYCIRCNRTAAGLPK